MAPIKHHDHPYHTLHTFHIYFACFPGIFLNIDIIISIFIISRRVKMSTRSRICCRVSVCVCLQYLELWRDVWRVWSVRPIQFNLDVQTKTIQPTPACMQWQNQSQTRVWFVPPFSSSPCKSLSWEVGLSEGDNNVELDSPLLFWLWPKVMKKKR